MAKEWAKQFYASLAWIGCRLSFLGSKFFICNRCEESATIAHHIIYLTPRNISDPFISLNNDNLEALCQGCHNVEHHGGDMEVVRDGLGFDSEGNLIQVCPPIK